MIWKWVPANPPPEDGRIVGVFVERTKVEYPVILSVPVLQKANGIFSAIPIQPLYTCGRISHNDYSVRDIGEIWTVVQSQRLSHGLVEVVYTDQVQA
jgi:hypothetical protein